LAIPSATPAVVGKEVDSSASTDEFCPAARSSGMHPTPADDLRAVAGHFGNLGADTPPERWDDPSPVASWTARDVVRQLIGWLPPLLQDGAGHRPGAFPFVDHDPVVAWRASTTEVPGLLDDPASAGKVLSKPHFSEVPVPQAVTCFFTNDVFQHTWDVARWTGQGHGMDPQGCLDLVAGMASIDEPLSNSGHYAPQMRVAADADPRRTWPRSSAVTRGGSRLSGDGPPSPGPQAGEYRAICAARWPAP